MKIFFFEVGAGGERGTWKSVAYLLTCTQFSLSQEQKIVTDEGWVSAPWVWLSVALGFAL